MVYSVWLTHLTTPITKSDWDKVHLSIEDSLFNSDGDFLGVTLTKTDIVLVITNDNVSTEGVTLTGRGNLLNRGNTDYFFVELDKLVDDFGFLDG